MTRKNWLFGFGRTLGAVVLSAGLVATGCGDDEEMTTVDAGVVDAAPEADACTAHGCGGDDNPFMSPNEGGEVRLELFQLPGDMQTLAAQAFFFSDQTPVNRPILGEPIDVSRLGIDYFTCHDYESGMYFNNGKHPMSQTITDSRTPIDVGDAITLTNANDANDVITLEKQPAGTADLSQFLQHKLLYLGDNTYDVTRNTFYNLAFEVSDTFAGLDLRNGISIQGDVTPPGPGVFFPTEFNLTSPTEEEYFGGVTLNENEDFVIEFEQEQTLDPDAPTPLTFLGIVDDANVVHSYCVKPYVDGEFILPYEVFDIIPDNGKMLFGYFTHLGWVQYEDEARIDMLGVNCKLSTYEKATAGQ